MQRIRFVVLAIALLTGACRSKTAIPQISVESAWGRPLPTGANIGAFYMVIRNEGSESDRLLSVTSEACGMAEIHESYIMDNGSMGMRPVEGGLEVPAGNSVELKIGGLHIMCMDKQADFVAGDKYPVTLMFERSGDFKVQVEIKDMP